MKKTLTIGMLAAVAVLMVLTGCKNSFTAPRSDSFKANADEYRSSSEKPLKVDSIGAVKYGGRDFYRVTVTFNQEVAKESDQAVRIVPLTDKGAGEKPEIGADIKPVEVNVDGKNLYLKVPTKDVKHLYVYVTGAGVKGTNGAVMNQDEDEECGEKRQDDYVGFLRIDSTVADLSDSSKNQLDQGNASIISYKDWVFIETVTVGGTGQNAAMVKEVTVQLKKNNVLVVLEDMGIDHGNITEVLNKHLEFEQFNFDKKVFEEVKTVFKYEGSKWVAAVTGLKPNRVLRAKWVDVKRIKSFSSTKSSKYAFEFVFDIKNTHANTVVVNNAHFSSQQTGSMAGSNGLWPSSNNGTREALGLEATKNGSDQVALTLLPVYTDSSNVENDVSFSIWHEKAKRNVSFKNKDGNYYSFKGFDATTLKRENFKVVGRFATSPYSIGKAFQFYGYEFEDKARRIRFAYEDSFDFNITNFKYDVDVDVDIKEKSFVSSSIAMYPDAVNKITLTLDLPAPPSGFDDMAKSKLAQKLSEKEDQYRSKITSELIEKSLLTEIRNNTYAIGHSGPPTDMDVSRYHAHLWRNHESYMQRLNEKVFDHVKNNLKKLEERYDPRSSTIVKSVYIGPNVTTAVSTGYYTNGSEKTAVPIPALAFAVPQASDNEYERDGWKQVTIQ